MDESRGEAKMASDWAWRSSYWKNVLETNIFLQPVWPFIFDQRFGLVYKCLVLLGGCFQAVLCKADYEIKRWTVWCTAYCIDLHQESQKICSDQKACEASSSIVTPNHEHTRHIEEFEQNENTHCSISLLRAKTLEDAPREAQNAPTRSTRPGQSQNEENTFLVTSKKNALMFSTLKQQKRKQETFHAQDIWNPSFCVVWSLCAKGIWTVFF